MNCRPVVIWKYSKTYFNQYALTFKQLCPAMILAQNSNFKNGWECYIHLPNATHHPSLLLHFLLKPD